MANKLPFFVEGLDGRLINISLISNVIIDHNDATDILWLYRNGEIYREDLKTEEEANNRLADIKSLLLGHYSELVETVNRQQQTIAVQQQTINETSTNLDEINGEIIEEGGN